MAMLIIVPSLFRLSRRKKPGSKEDKGDGGAGDGLQEGNMRNSHTSQLELSGLEAGVYQFRYRECLSPESSDNVVY